MNSGCAGSSSLRSGVNSGTSGSITAAGFGGKDSASSVLESSCVAVGVTELVGLAVGEGDLETAGRLLLVEDEGRSLGEAESFGMDCVLLAGEVLLAVVVVFTGVLDAVVVLVTVEALLEVAEMGSLAVEAGVMLAMV